MAKKAAEQQKSALGLLTSRLASSLDDGTPRGRLASQQFRELAPLVSAVVGKHCHGHALRLQAAYTSHDPQCQPAEHRDNVVSCGGTVFLADFHTLLRRAGFRLCSREDEVAALHGHFGNEQMWNVPVNIS